MANTWGGSRTIDLYSNVTQSQQEFAQNITKNIFHIERKKSKVPGDYKSKENIFHSKSRTGCRERPRPPPIICPWSWKLISEYASNNKVIILNWNRYLPVWTGTLAGPGLGVSLINDKVIDTFRLIILRDPIFLRLLSPIIRNDVLFIKVAASKYIVFFQFLFFFNNAFMKSDSFHTCVSPTPRLYTS